MAGVQMDWWDELYQDCPFNVHIVRNVEDAAPMIGEPANIYLEQLRDRYEDSLTGCVVTTVAGDPGTGKSYFFAHMIWRMTQIKDPPGIPILVKLKGREYSAKDIYKLIRGAPAYIKGCKDADISITQVSDEMLGSMLRKEILALRRTAPKTSICLFIDNVDEYVRSNAIRYEREEFLPRPDSRTKAMKGLLRIVNAIGDTVGTGILIVLSLTADMVTDFHLGDVKHNQNIVTGIVGADASLRSRFSPIYESNISAKFHLFGGIPLDDAYVLVSKYMEAWFKKHLNQKRRVLIECTWKGMNTYPFSVEAIELLHSASGYPGDIVLGCLSALQRFREHQNQSHEINPALYNADAYITASFAAMAVLQMTDYYVNVHQLDSKLISRLRSTIDSDLTVFYTDIFPQLVEMTIFNDLDLTRNLGRAFVDYLGRLGLGQDFVPTDLDSKFVRTRDRIRYPSIPLIDCAFTYKNKQFGIQFLSDNSPESNYSKIYTICHAIKAGGADPMKGDDLIDRIVLVCLLKDGDDEKLVSTVLSILNRGSENEVSLCNIQNKKYHPRVGVVVLHESVGWQWKATHEPGRMTEDQRNVVALTLENVDAIFWQVKGISIGQERKNLKWQSLLDILVKGREMDGPIEERKGIHEFDIRQ